MIDIQLVYKMIIMFLYSFFATRWLAERLIPKFKNKGYVVPDKYKKEKTMVANIGGMVIFTGLMVSLVISQILIKEFDISKLLIFYFIPIVFGTFGLLDDLIDVGKRWKIIAPFFMALPVSLLVVDTNISFFGFSIELGLLFLFIIAPVYVMVVTNLVNMHSGFNGLASGLSVILLFFLGLRSLILQNFIDLLYIIPIFGAVLAYHQFDKYPSKFIWGNSGSLMVGSAIGSYIILSNAEIFAIIILIPHIADFLLFFFSNVLGKTEFETVKFGSVRKDGTIKVPTPYKMKFILPYYFRLTEKQTVQILHGITIFFGIIATSYILVRNHL